MNFRVLPILIALGIARVGRRALRRVFEAAAFPATVLTHPDSTVSPAL